MIIVLLSSRNWLTNLEKLGEGKQSSYEMYVGILWKK